MKWPYIGVVQFGESLLADSDIPRKDRLGGCLFLCNLKIIVILYYRINYISLIFSSPSTGD